MFDHPQVLAEDMVAMLDHPLVGKYRGLTRAIKFSRTPGPEAFAAPTLGEHSGQLLLELGYSLPDIDRMRRRGITS